jgi:hypothetical protein
MSGIAEAGEGAIRARERAMVCEEGAMPKIGQGTNAANITDALLAYLTDAYREAAGKTVGGSEVHPTVGA